MQALQRYLDSENLDKTTPTPIPRLALSNDKRLLVPREIHSPTANTITLDLESAPVRIRDVQVNEPVCFLHSSVIRGRDRQASAEEGSTFLAELDLQLDSGAQLVLGLNNHHVGSYYWARSAGSGAAMDAPGVSFGTSSDGAKSGMLQWKSDGGPIDCNSNDGKRSEWVNFLRTGDTVQLLPFDVDDATLSIGGKGEKDHVRVFGVSSRNRPLGSEPAVVCEWRLH